MFADEGLFFLFFLLTITTSLHSFVAY